MVNVSYTHLLCVLRADLGKQCSQLPLTLSEGLRALKQDEVMVEALGGYIHTQYHILIYIIRHIYSIDRLAHALTLAYALSTQTNT